MNKHGQKCKEIVPIYDTATGVPTMWVCKECKLKFVPWWDVQDLVEAAAAVIRAREKDA